MKKLMVFAGSLNKTFLITALLLLNVINIIIFGDPWWLSFTVSLLIFASAATLIMHSIQKSNETKAAMDAERMKYI